MATRNRKIEPISDVVQKRNTKSKRTKVLVKKSKELSILCNLDINITIYDRTIHKVQQFSTKQGFTVQSIYQMIVDEKQKKGSSQKKFKMKIIDGLENHGLMGGDDDTDEEDEDTPIT